MDYEKLYKEALERAKEDISSGILARRETARYIFPELRESSEEMVRRTIISTLYRDDYLSTEEVNECVAWLEKQSKENMIEALRLEYEKGKTDGLQEQRKEWTAEDLLNRNEIADILQEYNRDDLIAWLEKQGKHESSESKGMNLIEEEMTPFQKGVFCIIDKSVEEERGLKQVCDKLLNLATLEISHKSAWSEEDERIRKEIIEFVEFVADSRSNKEEWLAWLKKRTKL